MLAPLSSPYLLLCLVATIVQVALVCIILRWKSFENYPLFALCIAGHAISGLVAYFVAWKFADAYFSAYYFGAILSAVLMCLASCEAIAKVFGPRIGVPEWAQLRFAIFISMSIAASVTITAVWRPLNGGPWTQWLLIAEHNLTIITWAIFSILWVYSRGLGISWLPRMQSIVLGFVLYLSIYMGMVFVRARWPVAATTMSGQVGTLAYLVALIVWVRALWGAELERKPATEEMMEELREHHRATMEAIANF